jgi:hypothetical protein
VHFDWPDTAHKGVGLVTEQLAAILARTKTTSRLHTVRVVPMLIAVGERAARGFLEFFAANACCTLSFTPPISRTRAATRC